ncbi:hypothetical protein QFC22_004827 [Naganishia vaughanmartiniae]|uniref:Uncharacterized protein n=1 Tax=Naganishia vaughanmartiniae TaxID=1424756 RepID=A0ACC2WZ17_9TREE|nr:hypothetical protein QFC22_004827 [Naganishia vaughanmartiniae]
MGGLSRFLNKITSSNDPSPPAPAVQQQQQHFAQPAYFQQQHGNGKRVVGYFNRGIYGPKYFPNMIPAPYLTHVMYSFANVQPATGTVVLTDAWADVEIHYDGDDWNEQGTNLYGNFKALYKLKQANRNLKVMLSIGGWSYRENFKNLVNPAHRAEFARSAVSIVEDVGLDGLDIDWEYPETQAEQQALVDLLRLCREALDDLAKRKGKPQQHYELSIAAPCGPQVYEKLMLPELDRYLTFWNLMLRLGSLLFSPPSYPDLGHPRRTIRRHCIPTTRKAPVSTERSNSTKVAESRHTRSFSVRPPGHLGTRLGGHFAYLFFSAATGIPVYGRRFQNTAGIGQRFSGVGENEGLVPYRELQVGGGQLVEDSQMGSSYLLNPHAKELITYDSPNIAIAKAQYINRNQLGGAMFWSLELDRRPGEDQQAPALIPLMSSQMEGGLLYSENELQYPFSKYDNLRSGRI